MESDYTVVMSHTTADGVKADFIVDSMAYESVRTGQIPVLYGPPRMRLTLVKPEPEQPEADA